MKPTFKILATTFRTVTPVIGFCFLATFAQASPTVATNNIFSSATASANSGLTQYGVGDPTAVNDGTSSQFFFGDNTGTNELLSLTGFNATSGIDTIVFFGNTFGNRTSPGVKIYTSTSDVSSANALTLSYYTPLGGTQANGYTATDYALPTTTALDNAYAGGTDSASGRSYDILSGLDIAANTESILFSFDGSVFGSGNGFTEIQGFPTSDTNPSSAPEPSTWALLLMAVGILMGLSKIRNISSVSLK